MKVREFLLTAAFVAVCVAAGAQDINGVIYACASKQSGAMRMVPPPGTCKSTEISMVWAVQGPKGPKGPVGSTGPQGPQGVPGTPATLPQNLTSLSNNLSTNGQAALGPEYFHNTACANMHTGDIVLSVNGYGGPSGALPADGRLLTINSNTALFSLVGTTFGGDGTSNFALPDLRPFAPKGLQYSICVNGQFPSRN